MVRFVLETLRMKSSICKTENLTERIEFQKQEVARLKREIFGTDRKPRSAYIREFLEEHTDYEAVSNEVELLRDARRARIIYVGDYHALTQSQLFAARLLEKLRNCPVLLGLEMLYGRNQAALEDWMRERIDDEGFFRRVRYELEWGYDPKGFLEILRVARRYGMPTRGIDYAPRNDLRYIRKRDSNVAAKIADILKQNPGRMLVVVFGESHLAGSHLPAKVLGHFRDGPPPRSLIILQNLDEIYWKAACAGDEAEDLVLRLRPGVYCVLNATPFEKYESYRRQLEIWRSQDREDRKVDLTSTVYNLIGAISDFLGVARTRECLRFEGVCLERFIEAYPEVYGILELQDFESLLESSTLSPTQIKEIMNHVVREQSCYVARVNAIFIGKFNLVHGAEEAAHFVNFALKQQRYEEYRKVRLDPEATFYLMVLEEALGYFGSKIIVPTRNHLADSPVFHWKALPKPERELLGISWPQVRWMRRFVREHKRSERSRRKDVKTSGIITEGVSSRGRTFTLLTHELGYLLGEQIYRGYLEGVFSRTDLAALFRKRFEDRGSPRDSYFEIAEKTEPLLPRSSSR